MIAMAVLILGVSSGCKKRPPEKTKEPLSLGQTMEEVNSVEKINGEEIVLIAIKYNIPSQTVKDVLKEHELRKWDEIEKGSLSPTIAETESAIEGYAQKYQTSKEKIASILWDWMMYNRTTSGSG